MPVYDYMCDDCGPFTEVHPMSRCEEAQPCPRCRALSPRAILRAPHFAGMDARRRTAFATNERSASAPMSVGEYAQKSDRSGHGAGCGCCAPKMQSRTRVSPGGAKSFPTARPWMISH